MTEEEEKKRSGRRNIWNNNRQEYSQINESHQTTGLRSSENTQIRNIKIKGYYTKIQFSYSPITFLKKG